MKTSIIAICLIIGVIFSFGFSDSGQENKNDSKINLKIVTEKDGKTSIADTVISFNGEPDESIINDLLRSFGFDDKGESIVKNILVNIDGDGQNDNMKFVIENGDTIISQIVNCCMLNGDSSCTKKCIDKSDACQENNCQKLPANCCIESRGVKDTLEVDDTPTLNADNILNVEKLNFYPNPNNGKFDLSFKLTEEKYTKINIFDSNGGIVYKEELPEFKGEYNKVIDISSKGKGIYILNIEQGNKALNKKLIIK